MYLRVSAFITLRMPRFLVIISARSWGYPRLRSPLFDAAGVRASMPREGSTSGAGNLSRKPVSQVLSYWRRAENPRPGKCLETPCPCRLTVAPFC